MDTMDTSTNQSDSANSDVLPSKRRRKKSMVWEYFTIETVSGDCMRACCKLCNKSFAYMSGSKMSGTSHLKRHITLGICPVSRHQNQGNNLLMPCTTAPKTNIIATGTNFPRKRRAANRVSSKYFNVDNCRNELAKMIIQHDYPIHMVVHSGFVSFAQMLQPQFDIPSVSTLQDQIMDIYFREKQMILDLLSRISGRINLTFDIWTANQNSRYLLIAGYFIDHDWKLQKRILNVVALEFSDLDTAFNQAISGCVADWRSEDKLFTFTLDHSYASGNIREHLRSLLPIKNSVILNDQLLISSCYTRLVRNLAHDAISSMKDTVEKVRHSVKYVKASKAHEERFTILKQQLQVPSSKNLIIDDLRKWNTTYHMLVAAFELKEVFSCLDAYDPDYKLNLSLEDWKQVETLCTFLKVFYEAADILTSPVYPTTNLFFHEAWKIHIELMHTAVSQDSFVCCLTKPLRERFSKYWEDCNMVLAVAVILDPRFKIQLVQFSFCRIYGDDAGTSIKIVDEGLHELYFEYVLRSLPPPGTPPTFIEESNYDLVKLETVSPEDGLPCSSDNLVKSEVVSPEDGLLSCGDNFSDVDVYISDFMVEQHMDSELDQYLEEPLLPRVQDFDVLGWWKANRSRYPTLSQLAADVLSIPLSTVAPEAVFDTRESVLDNHLSSLSPTMLQAIVCAKDWLQHESLEIPATPVKTEF